MAQKTTTWLLVGAVAIVAIFLFLRNRGPSVVGGSPGTDPLKLITALAPVAEAEYAAQGQAAITASQERVQLAAINAGVQTASINAGAQYAAAARQNAAQQSSQILDFIGRTFSAVLPFIA